MENSIYYAFSTIAQCVAAICALLGAVTLYRLQRMDVELLEIAKRVAKPIIGNVDAAAALSTHDYEKLLKVIDANAGLDVYRNDSVKVLIYRLAYLTSLRNSIVNFFSASFGLSVITIMFCVCVLSSVHRWEFSDYIFVFGIAAVGFCSGAYAALISKLMK